METSLLELIQMVFQKVQVSISGQMDQYIWVNLKEDCKIERVDLEIK